MCSTGWSCAGPLFMPHLSSPVLLSQNGWSEASNTYFNFGFALNLSYYTHWVMRSFRKKEDVIILMESNLVNVEFKSCGDLRSIIGAVNLYSFFLWNPWISKELKEKHPFCMVVDTYTWSVQIFGCYVHKFMGFPSLETAILHRARIVSNQIEIREWQTDFRCLR